MRMRCLRILPEIAANTTCVLLSSWTLKNALGCLSMIVPSAGIKSSFANRLLLRLCHAQPARDSEKSLLCYRLPELLSIPDNDRPCCGAAKLERLSNSSNKACSAKGRRCARAQPATVCVALHSSSDSMGHRHAGNKKWCSRLASPDSEYLYRLAARSSC